MAIDMARAEYQREKHPAQPARLAAELQTFSNHMLIQHQNLQPPNQICANCRLLIVFHSFVLLLLVCFLSSLVMSFLFSLLVFLCSFLVQPPLPLLFSAPLFLPLLLAAMDHAQGRAFYHHLARAIMHLTHLAGLLPFFEPY